MHPDSSLHAVRSLLRPRMAELSLRREGLYWTDLLVTSAVAWSTLLLGAAITGGGALAGGARAGVSLLLFVVAVLALYRGTSFMHEVTHVRRGMPRYALAWDVLIGVPLLMPSLLYVGVHDTHHDHRVFGTERDPEFVQHQGEGRVGHLSVVGRFALTPMLLALRWLVLAPLSFTHGGVRRFVVERLSSFSSNPAYRRPIPRGAAARRWLTLEVACSAWTALLLASALAGLASLASLGFAWAAVTCVSVLHGMRSLATHRFHGRGAPRTVEEQFLDSVNVTGHPLWTELWAPAGLRYHALHHLAPRLPYHALGRAHRALLGALPADDVYRRVTFAGLAEVIQHVLASASDTPSPGVPPGRRSHATA